MEIKYLQNNQIDFDKWDQCIKRSYNGVIYAYSWYLNIVSENWGALVLGDYETVMPITSNKKYGINYLVQPIYSQQLGVFSNHKTNPGIVNTFLDNIPSSFKLIDIKLNIFNHAEEGKFVIISNSNYELDLIQPYESLKENFTVNTKRNIQKARKHGISVMEGATANELINLFKAEIGGPKNNFGDNEYNKLRQIIAFAIRHRSGEIYGAYTAENTLCAATFFLKSNNRIINLVSASTEEGFEKRAMFAIMNEVILKNCEKNMILDFEGSNIEGIARFFKGFGSTKCEYQTIKLNNLPFPLNLLKK